MRLQTAISYFILALALSSCTGLKHITPDDPLLADSKIEHKTRITNTAKLSTNAALQPSTNSRLLWMRPALARYNMLGDSARTKKFWRGWIREPVLLSDSDPEFISRTISNRLFHEGYFDNTVEVDTVLHRLTAELRYKTLPGDPYYISSISFPLPVDTLNAEILSLKAESLVESGDIYSLRILKEERKRITGELKDIGYINFSPDMLEYRVDTSSKKGFVNMALFLKSNTPYESKQKYRVRKIFIHDDYQLSNYRPDTIAMGDYVMVSENKRLRAEPLINGIFIKPNKIYSQTDQKSTLQYMNRLPLIRYATLKFTEGDSPGSMDARLYLSQRKRYAYTAEFNAMFRSTNYFGPGFILSYKDRNLRGGAEELSVNLRGRFEMQIADGQVNPAVELGTDIIYSIPNSWPKLIRKLHARNIPDTRVTIGYQYFNRFDLYLLNSLFFKFGYDWKAKNKFHHYINPIEISYTSVPESSKSDKFREYLAQNPGVQQSFENQLIFGTGYDFTYNPQDNGRGYFYFNGGVELAGNLTTLITSTYQDRNPPDDPYTLGNIPISQYARFRADFRYEYNITRGSSIATRFVSGLGFPYGNSTVIPYIKQFFVGGTNSLRSFLARSVGPGSEVPPQGFTDLTGDMKLEANVEYRFSMTRNFKGALFVDAGNIWLVNTDPDRPNATFKWPGWINEVAMSAGWGLRWDFEFVVIRLDLGYTIRTPYLPEGQRWASEINFLRPTFNFAIGYPY